MSMSEYIKLECGCYASPATHGWIVEASAFLCEKRHHQGDFVPEPASSAVSRPANTAAAGGAETEQP